MFALSLGCEVSFCAPRVPPGAAWCGAAWRGVACGGGRAGVVWLGSAWGGWCGGGGACLPGGRWIALVAVLQEGNLRGRCRVEVTTKKKEQLKGEIETGLKYAESKSLD